MGKRDRRVPDSGNESKIPRVVFCMDMGGGKSSVCIYEDLSPTLATTHYGAPVIGYCITEPTKDCREGIKDED